MKPENIETANWYCNRLENLKNQLNDINKIEYNYVNDVDNFSSKHCNPINTRPLRVNNEFVYFDNNADFLLIKDVIVKQLQSDIIRMQTKIEVL